MISVPGIGSGLDINAIVDGLVAAEGDAKTQLLARERASIESEISAFGNLKNIINQLQAQTSKLASANTYTSTTATSQAPSFFIATAESSVAESSYDIEIRALAESQKLMSAGFAGLDTDVGSGTLTISVGSNSFDVDIEPSNQTLADVRNAINDAEDNTGVTATILTVDDGAGGVVSKLVLTADETGTANELTITVADDDSNNTDGTGLSAFYYDTADATTPEQMTEINAAVDAELYVDGQRILSATNTVTDAIDGVTLTLNKAETGTINQLTIANDIASVKSAIEVFVSNYNSFASLTSNLTAFNADTGSAGLLLGDATLRTLSNAVRTDVSKNVNGVSGELDNLVELGITTNSVGQFEIDDAVLQDALTNNPEAVAEFFSSDDGQATRLNNVLNEYVKSDGILDNKTKGLNETVDDINEDLATLELRLQSLEERLFAQFSTLDLLLSELNSTSNFLTQQFEQISQINRPRSGS